MSDELQALCLHAGASSVFLGDKLLTTANPGEDHDTDLLGRLDTKKATLGLRMLLAPLLEADSSGRRDKELTELFCGSVPVESLAWSCVEERGE